MDLSRRLPEGSAGRKTCACFETLASRDAASTGVGQGAHGGGGLPIAIRPPALLELAPFGPCVQPKRELTARKSKENQGKRLGFPSIPLVPIWTFQRVTAKK
jgi:hypothetical protein